jgi:hypothetical protein
LWLKCSIFCHHRCIRKIINSLPLRRKLLRNFFLRVRSNNKKNSRWTWHEESITCLLYEGCTKANGTCQCYTAPRCQEPDEYTTPTLVGGVESVEVLLDRGPSCDVVSDLPEERQFPSVATFGDQLYLCGGLDENLQAKSTCFYYKFVGQEWFKMESGLPSGPLSRSAGIGAYWDFYFMGGDTDLNETTDTARSFISTKSPDRIYLFLTILGSNSKC